MRMANKTNVNANKEAETVEEVKAVDDAPVTEGTDVKVNESGSETIGEGHFITNGTDVKVNEEETVPADKKEEVEAAKPKPVSKGNRRGSKALQLELEKAKELAAGNEEKYKRLLAEFENMRQRNEKESKKMYDIGAKEVLEKLLPVVDNLERALSSIPEEDMDRAFEQGVDKIYRQLMVSLEGLGVKPMDAEGKPFDPDYHNAVTHVEDENYGENVVAEEMQKGYMYKDQVLRYSMVKVAN